MRIISGKNKGFRFPEKSMPHVRPTTDRAKESLFSILDQHYYFDQISVLDLYSGMGSIALEFCSRGSTEVIAVDSNRKSVKYISEIAEKMNVSLDLKCVKTLDFLNRNTEQFDVVFADPPYSSISEIQSLLEFFEQNNPLKKDGMLILEHATAIKQKSSACYDSRTYGQSTFSFFTFGNSK